MLERLLRNTIQCKSKTLPHCIFLDSLCLCLTSYHSYLFSRFVQNQQTFGPVEDWTAKETLRSAQLSTNVITSGIGFRLSLCVSLSHTRTHTLSLIFMKHVVHIHIGIYPLKLDRSSTSLSCPPVMLLNLLLYLVSH